MRKPDCSYGRWSPSPLPADHDSKRTADGLTGRVRSWQEADNVQQHCYLVCSEMKLNEPVQQSVATANCAAAAHGGGYL
jgi:hypothetical protein